MTDTYTTLEVARMLGLAVRSVQLMVDRGELQAWKTPGGHRRILRQSVEEWRAQRGLVHPASPAPAPVAKAATAPNPAAPAVPGPPDAPQAGSGSVLLIEDSKHFQNLVSLLMRQHFPDVALHVADDGIAGLALAGRLQPQVLIVDILLPGIDGATLINSLRTHPQFSASRLVVVTSLDAEQRTPYAFALEGLPVIHKPHLVAQLPGKLRELLRAQTAAAA